MQSVGSKASATVLAVAFWIAFIVLFLAFFTGDLDFWQKLAVSIASCSIVVGIVAALWIKWTLNTQQQHREQ